ncbi:MAG: lytic transglycosylase domain-containing protein [Hyphomicrobiales bacterium]
MSTRVFLVFALCMLTLTLRPVSVGATENVGSIPDFPVPAFYMSLPHEETTIPGFIVQPDAKRYWPLGEGEKELAIKALKHALAGQHMKAQEIKSELDDPTARKLIDWLWVHARRGGPSLSFLKYFVAENPNWPKANVVHGRIERSMMAGGVKHREALAYFKDRKPRTSSGMVVYARALMSIDKTDEAENWVRKAYRSVRVPMSLAGKIADEFSSILTDEDRLARLDGLIVHHETTLAVRASRGMDKNFQKYAKAAHRLLTGSKNAQGAFNAVPLRLRHQPGLQYARVRYRLRKKKPVGAAEVMLKANATGIALPYPERWWKMRRAMIQDSLSAKKPKLSQEFVYKLAKAHGLTSGKFLTDAEWMAGWVAFSFLDKPEVAANHFRASAKTAIRTYDKSRGHYWLGRALEKLGEKDEARYQHQTAAGFGYTFYGLLSESHVGGFLHGESLPPSADPTRAERVAVRQSELARAVQMLAHENARKEIKIFFKSMANTYKTPGEHGALIEMADEIGDVYLAMKFARYSEWRGIHVGTAAFPTEVLPKAKPLTQGEVEKPLVLGVARQESEFNGKAVSRVGARGLMQIMPATARWLCRIHKIKCSQKRLTADPAFNVQLGSAFLYRLVREWRGSYIMATAAYNAGGARVLKWNASVGDPRKGEISALDWVELIPFSETRNYVKRVMRNVQIYRRQMDPDAAITLVEDLERGAKTKDKAAQAVSE